MASKPDCSVDEDTSGQRNGRYKKQHARDDIYEMMPGTHSAGDLEKPAKSHRTTSGDDVVVKTSPIREPRRRDQSDGCLH